MRQKQNLDTSGGLNRSKMPCRALERLDNLRRERQLEGIAGAKARGIYTGRKPTIDPEKIRKMKADGMGRSAIAKTLKIGRAPVYRALTS